VRETAEGDGRDRRGTDQGGDVLVGDGAATTRSTSLTGYLLLGLAVVTCPCHLPILLALLAGTGLAGVLSQHVALVFGGLALTFAVSLLLGLRALRRDPAPRG
jgi:mercuric ion transport protein